MREHQRQIFLNASSALPSAKNLHKAVVSLTMAEHNVRSGLEELGDDREDVEIVLDGGYTDITIRPVD